MRWIYISPHLDDAIFSAGGLMYEQSAAGHVVEVWTLFSGLPSGESVSPLAADIQSQWGFRSADETVRSRRDEDRRAVEIVGARATHFDFSDCIYRSGSNGGWLYSDTFAPPHPDDDGLFARLTDSIARRLRPDDILLCPLAIGSHVDHVLARRAAERLGWFLLYYADIPYLLENPSALDPIENSMRSETKAISKKGLAAWQDSAAAYASQIPMEFDNKRKLRKAIARYGKPGIRLWSLP
jgi:LmbE family N-acetylglucosaminyl deacetylase